MDTFRSVYNELSPLSHYQDSALRTPYWSYPERTSDTASRCDPLRNKTYTSEGDTEEGARRYTPFSDADDQRYLLQSLPKRREGVARRKEPPNHTPDTQTTSKAIRPIPDT